MEWDCGNQTFTSPCNYSFPVNATNQGMHLTITYSDVNNPVRKIRIIMPGYSNNYESDPFYSPFVNYLASENVFKGLRCMDLMKTNGSPLTTWSQRTPKDFYTQTTPYGIAYEYMIDLVNRLNKDIWICIPHQADDNYIHQFATLLRDSVKTGRKIYVEYSNECWNSIFSQTQFCNSKGAELGYSDQSWEQGWKFYAKRSADCHRIFESVIGSNNPYIVKVVASQTANSWLTNQIMTFYNTSTYNPTGVRADALAIAPYFGGHIADSIGDARAVNTITIPQIVTSMHAAVFSQTQNMVIANKIVADRHKVRLIAYEGGQHLVGNRYQNDTILTKKLIAANRDPMMETIYCDMIDAWFNNGGKEFYNYSSMYKPNKYGSWGVLENTEQPLISSFKWKAFRACGITTGINISDYSSENTMDIELFPNPSSGKFQLSMDNNYSNKNSIVSIFYATGQKIYHAEITDKNHNIDISHHGKGIYFVRVTINKMILSKIILIV